MPDHKKTEALEKRISELETELAFQKQNEELLSMVVKQSVNSVAIVDIEGNLVYANPTLLSVYGGSVEGVMDKNWRTFLSGSSTLHDHFDELAEVVLVKGETWQNEISDQDMNGETVWRRSTISPIKNSDSQVTHIFYTSEDITDRKKAEEALRLSEKKFRELVENIDEAFFIINLEGYITYMSPAISQILGYTPDELFDAPVSKLILKDDLPVLLKEWEELKSGAIHPSEYRMVTKSGGIRWVRSYTRPNIEEGSIVELRGVLSDITEQKRSQEIMIQTEKMMSVGGLAGGMAHEINNPLGAILQSAQMIARRLDPGREKNIEAAKKFNIDLSKLHEFLAERHVFSFLDGIKKSGERAADIVASMLQFTRKSESKLAPTYLSELLDNTIELARNDYNLKDGYDFRHIKIVKEFDPQLNEIPCTRTEIEQVILNLLRNAAHSMSGRNDGLESRIILRTRRETEMARIEIEDNGSGMDETVRRRVFEPFFTTKQEGSGTGLGLSVSYMIITNNHYGHIEVESEPNVGSKFIIQLPLTRNFS